MSKEKRKKVVLSIETKLEALTRLDRGETMQKIADELGVGRVTVGDWKRKRHELEKWSCDCQSEDVLKKRKSMKGCEYEKTSEALILWFSQQKSKGVPISGPILQEKALMFQKELKDGEEGFTASVGWLDRWKKRYGVRQLTVCGEKLSADSQDIDNFRKKFHKLIDDEGLTGEQLYNCDESGLNFKLLPKKSLASREEKSAPGFKMMKQRVTILACCNATGNHKLKLLCIGKYKKPRAFKNLSTAAFPVNYKNQKNAWMDSEIFREWFFAEFVPSVKIHLKSVNLPEKAILLLDNAACHPNVDELISGDIKVMFLPPNSTPLCQPMDQGVFATLKKKYSHKLLSKIICDMDEENNCVVDILKKINLKDVIFWIAECWHEIQTHTIARSWKVLNSVDNVETLQTNDDSTCNVIQLLQKIPGCEEADENDIEEWMNENEQYELSDDDIISSVVSAEVQCDEESDSEVDLEKEKNVLSHSEAVKMFQSVLTYVERQPEATATDVMSMRRWRDLAARKRAASVRQKTITDFFKK